MGDAAGNYAGSVFHWVGSEVMSDKEIATRARERLNLREIVLEGLELSGKLIAHIENVQYRITGNKDSGIQGRVLRRGMDGFIRDGALYIPMKDPRWKEQYDEVLVMIYWESPDNMQDISLVARVKPEEFRNDYT